ncbi:transposase [Streptomyces sp. NPDC005374]|uniref:transposase n=1 Tax=Streptomyces sp. NPDC005374 TaxID=3364713 RepID=UPI0036CE1249
MSLSDSQWVSNELLLPDRTPRRGGRWPDHRQLIDAIAFKYRTGTTWMDLPEHFGSWKSVHNRLRRWAADGTWERMFTALPPRPTPKAISPGSSWSTPPSPGLICTPPGPVRRGPGRRAGPSCPRTVPRRSDHEDPPRRGQPLPSTCPPRGWWQRGGLAGGAVLLVETVDLTD